MLTYREVLSLAYSNIKNHWRYNKAGSVTIEIQKDKYVVCFYHRLFGNVINGFSKDKSNYILKVIIETKDNKLIEIDDKTIEYDKDKIQESLNIKEVLISDIEALRIAFDYIEKENFDDYEKQGELCVEFREFTHPNYKDKVFYQYYIGFPVILPKLPKGYSYRGADFSKEIVINAENGQIITTLIG